MSKGDIKSKILIKSNNKFFYLGDIILKSKKGEIFYKPSITPSVALNGAEPVPLEHFSWHASGGVNFKLKNNKHISVEHGIGETKNPGTRQILQDIGYQELFREFVSNFSVLQTTEEGEGNVILDGKGHDGPFVFLLSLVSGTHIIASFRGKETSVHSVNLKDNPLFLDIKTGCLGAESGNADKLIQYHLEKYTHKMEEGKRLFSPAPDSQIKKIVYE